MSTTASSIEWTDRTWNPVRGCSRVSEGCRNCYAERQAARNLPGMRSPSTGKPFATMRESGPRWTGDVELITAALAAPLSWRKPARIFVNSMSDLFHESLSDAAIDRVFGAMACAPWHTYQILTKRAARMHEYFSLRRGPGNVLTRIITAARSMPKPKRWEAAESFPWPMPKVWLGVSVEDQATADERIPLLLQTPAAVRFVSYEPALGPIDFSEFQPFCRTPIEPSLRKHLRSIYPKGLPANSLNAVYERIKLDQVIIGGESGPRSRPFSIEWMRSAVAQCRAADVAAFCKQVGSSPVWFCGQCGRHAGKGIMGGFVDSCGPTHAAAIAELIRIRDSKGGDPSEWPAGDWPREFPAPRTA